MCAIQWGVGRLKVCLTLLVLLLAAVGIWRQWGLSAISPRAQDVAAPFDVEAIAAVVRQTAAENVWRQIPWRVSLWEARQAAARERKPILLWVMDGHPMGFT